MVSWSTRLLLWRKSFWSLPSRCCSMVRLVWWSLWLPTMEMVQSLQVFRTWIYSLSQPLWVGLMRVWYSNTMIFLTEKEACTNQQPTKLTCTDYCFLYASQHDSTCLRRRWSSPMWHLRCYILCGWQWALTMAALWKLSWCSRSLLLWWTMRLRTRQRVPFLHWPCGCRPLDYAPNSFISMVENCESNKLFKAYESHDFV